MANNITPFKAAPRFQDENGRPLDIYQVVNILLASQKEFVGAINRAAGSIEKWEQKVAELDTRIDNVESGMAEDAAK